MGHEDFLHTAIAESEAFSDSESMEVHTKSLLEQFENNQIQRISDLEARVESLPIEAPERDRAEKVLHNFKCELTKKSRYLILILGMLSPLTGQASNEHSDESIDEPTKISRAYEKALDTLSDKVWSDNHETKFVLYGVEGQEKKIINVKGESGSDHVSVTRRDQWKMDTKIMEIQQDNSELLDEQKLVVLHNHPAQLAGKYYGISEDVLEQMKEGSVKPMVMPPSMTDLFSFENAGYGNIKIVGQVQEPSGTWTFSHDKEHPIVKIYRRSMQFDYAPPQGVDLETAPEIDPRTRSLVGGMIDGVEVEVMENYGFSYSDTFVDLLNTTDKIRSMSSQGEDVSPLVEEYIELAGRLGIDVQYTPLQR